jgi:hypothetical protein
LNHYATIDKRRNSLYSGATGGLLDHETFGIVAAGLAAVSTVMYLVSIWRGQTRPSRVAYWIWFLMGACIFFTYRKSGGTTHWQQLVYIGNSLSIALHSLWFGEGVSDPRELVKNLSRLDKAAIAVTVVSMPYWYLLTLQYGDVPEAAIPVFLLLMSVDIAGCMPVFEKSWNRPESEDKFAWLIGCLGAALNIGAVTAWGIPDIVWNGWIVGAQVVIVLMLFFRPRSTAVTPRSSVPPSTET